jgi:nucleotide-binding universal stress UspA family protein
MHVIVATDGSRQSLAAARHLISFADPGKITTISVVAVIRPLAAVAFADEISESEQRSANAETLSFREAAQGAVDAVAAVFDGWGPKVTKRIRSGSPCSRDHQGGRAVRRRPGRCGGRRTRNHRRGTHRQHRSAGQHYAPCPVLVVRPAPRPKKTARQKA